MSLKQKFNVQCLTPVDFSTQEELTLEWPIAGYVKYLAHKSLLIYQKNKSQGTHSTKTRSEVRGGGKKPWKQKGTGRARAGSSRSPLWRGGGVIFGPKPRTLNLKLNKKEKKVIFKTLIHSNLNNLIVLENLSCFANLGKTKDFLSVLQKMQMKVSPSTPIINYLILSDTPEIYETLKRVSKNIPNVQLVQQENMNIPFLLKPNQKIILTKDYVNSLCDSSAMI